MAKSVALTPFIPEAYSKKLHQFAIAACAAGGISERLGVIYTGAPELRVCPLYGETIGAFGYSPSCLLLEVPTNVAGSGRPDWESRLELARFNFDVSNCGIGHIHMISNVGHHGLGVHVLNLLENIMIIHRRRFIICSISSRQVDIYKADKWLEKYGYTKGQTFVGGNSGKTCFTYYKDLNKTPITTLKENDGL